MLMSELMQIRVITNSSEHICRLNVDETATHLAKTASDKYSFPFGHLTALGAQQLRRVGMYAYIDPCCDYFGLYVMLSPSFLPSLPHTPLPLSCVCMRVRVCVAFLHVCMCVVCW